jgi:hypothetical protein
VPLNPVCLKSQIEFAMNQRCTQKYKNTIKSPWKSLRSGSWNNMREYTVFKQVVVVLSTFWTWEILEANVWKDILTTKIMTWVSEVTAAFSIAPCKQQVPWSTCPPIACMRVDGLSSHQPSRSALDFQTTCSFFLSFCPTSSCVFDF